MSFFRLAENGDSGRPSRKAAAPASRAPAEGMTSKALRFGNGKAAEREARPMGKARASETIDEATFTSF
jgi:hypothetical protein